MRNLAQNLFILFLTVLTLSGCGNGRSLKFRAGNSALGDGAELAHCNAFNISSSSVSGAMMTYRSAEGVEDSSKINLKLTQVPAEFWSSDRSIAFHKWHPTGASRTVEVAQFQIEYLDSSGSIKSLGTNQVILSRANLEDQMALAGLTSTPEVFLDSARIVLIDVAHTWKVAQISYYEGETGVGTVNALLPPFSAHPSIYRTNHVELLAEIHPYDGNQKNGWIGQDYVDALHNYCF